VGGGPVSWSGTVGPVTIVRLTRLANGREGQPRWRVILSDHSEAVTETGAPVGFTITNPANAGPVMVEFRRDKIIKITPAPAGPRTTEGT
jgi:hypothetical protein